MNDKAALIIIFNHRYDKNIPVLESLYRHRFSNIFFLVPFYDGTHPNVIPVYENSYCFQGFIAQGFQSFFKEEFAHYFFIGDDLILNPAIDEYNYKDYFQLDKEACFIPELFEPQNLTNNHTLRFIPHKRGKKTKLYWWRVMELARYKHWINGLENTKEMPGYAEAAALLAHHGYRPQSLKFCDSYAFFPKSLTTKKDWQAAWYYLKKLRFYKRKFKLAYPVVASYSDIVIVSKEVMKTFAHYCGVLATNGLFVEFALPTALLLASKKVLTEPFINKRGSIYWTYDKEEAEHYEEAMKPYQKKLSRLINDFPAGKLYIHPVKLSQWNTQLDGVL